MFSSREAAVGRRELAKVLGVTVASLDQLGVGVGYDWQGKKFYSFPERDMLWRPCGICRRYEDGSKKHMPGSSPGLYMAKEWWTGIGPILLPEGGSDVAAMLSMGLCAVGRSSNTGSVERLIGLLSDQSRPVIVIGENDKKPERIGKEKDASKDADGGKLCSKYCPGCAWCFPGKFGAVVTAKRLTVALNRPVYHRMVAGAKDTRAWLQANGANRMEYLESLKLPQKWLLT